MLKSILTFVFLSMLSLSVFSQEICDNGIDDDGDNLIDLNDTTDCACTGLGGTANVTSYIPNSDFEQTACCPSSWSQLNCAQGWSQATDATSDYMNTCNFMPSGVTSPALNPNGGGAGFAGFIAMGGWQEYIGSCLNQPLIAGTQYQMTLDISAHLTDGSLLDCGPINFSDLNLTLFGNQDCNSLPVSTSGCPDGLVGSGSTVSWVTLGSANYVPSNNWGSVTITFTPNANMNAIIIGSPCTLPADYGNSGSATCFPYFAIDNLLLTTSAALNGLTVTDSGSFYTGDATLNASIDTSAGSFQWYINGVAISGATDTILDLMPFSCTLSTDTFTFVQTVNGNCASSSFVISSGPPIANFSTNDICVSSVANFLDLSGTSPSGSPITSWSWDFGDTSPPDITQNPNHPYSQPGTYTVELIVSDGPCSDTTSIVIQVDSLVNVTSNSTNESTCGTCDGTAIANVSGGVAPYFYSWNTVPVQATQNIANLCGGTYYVTITDSSNCPQVIDTIVIISNTTAPPPVVTPAGPFCTTDPTLNLITSSIGGIWSGNGITDVVNGTFDPATAGIGAHQIIYADSGSCPGSDTILIVVNSVFDATINLAGPFCESGASTILTAVDLGGIWSGVGITDSIAGIFDPVVAGIGTYTITYGIAGNCGDTQTVNITVDPDADATINLVNPVCLVSPMFDFTALQPNGVWSGNGITDVVNGTFDPAIAGIGVHTITYGIAGACGDTQTTNITVANQFVATINLAGPFCESSTSTILTAVDGGGVWSGNGITNTNNGTFDPVTAGPGTHTITYEISGACGDTQTVDIVVIPDEDATINPIDSACVLDVPFNFTSVEPNGIWSGNGITSANAGTFDPGIAGVGVHVITYTIAGACGDAQTTNITVTPQDDATITAVGPFCVNEPSVNLTSVTNGGMWSGIGITDPTNGVFDPSVAGPGTHTITYTTPGACGDTDTEDVIVNPLPQVIFSTDTTSLCEFPAQAFMFFDSTVTLGGIEDSLLFWDFGDGTNAGGFAAANDTVFHTYTNSGVYDVTLTVTSTTASGGCTNDFTEIAFVEVFENPIADFTMNPNPVSMFDPLINFIDQSTVFSQPATYAWDIGGLDSMFSSNFNYIFPEDTGNYLIILTVTDKEGCVNTVTNIATVTGEYGIYIPNSFTPDGDGLNDGFFPDGFGITDGDYSFMIFDRWGEKIFESNTKFEPWNGSYKGKLVQNGVYVWRLEFRDINGEFHKEMGHATVIR
jgi:gliding motility-associated-like protein